MGRAARDDHRQGLLRGHGEVGVGAARRQLEVRQALLDQAEVEQGLAQVVVGAVVLGEALQAGPQVRRRLRRTAQVEQDVPVTVVQLRVLGPQPARALVVRQGLVPASEADEGLRETPRALRARWIQGEGPAERGLGLCRVLWRAEGLAEQRPRQRLVRRERRRPAQVLERRLALAELLQHLGEVEVRDEARRVHPDGTPVAVAGALRAPRRLLQRAEIVPHLGALGDQLGHPCHAAHGLLVPTIPGELGGLVEQGLRIL